MLCYVVTAAVCFPKDEAGLHCDNVRLLKG